MATDDIELLRKKLMPYREETSRLVAEHRVPALEEAGTERWDHRYQYNTYLMVLEAIQQSLAYCDAAEQARDWKERCYLLRRANVYYQAVESVFVGAPQPGAANYTPPVMKPAICSECGEYVPLSSQPGFCVCDDCNRPRTFRCYKYIAPGNYQYVSETNYHGSRWLSGEW